MEFHHILYGIQLVSHVYHISEKKLYLLFGIYLVYLVSCEIFLSALFVDLDSTNV